MSTFLQLASRLRQEVGGSGTGPTAVTSQTGEYKRFVDWIATADEDIQRMYNQWRFMVGTFTLNTVSDDGSYLASECITPVTDLRDWKTETMKIYLLSAGTSDETLLQYIDYQVWYEMYNTRSQTSSRPMYFTIGNDQSIKLGPIPNAVYRVSGEYQKSIDTLAASADVPNYPAEYHMLAVYGAMMMYARYSGASEVYQDANNRYKKMLNEMKRTQLPKMRMAGALA